MLNSLNNKNLYDILKEKIKKRNYDISETRKNEDKKSENFLEPENYFLIIKTKIPLFEEEQYKEYGNLIDFLDIPGLDENGNSNFDNFIGPIFKNILFPIFICDVQSYSDDEPKNLIKQFFEYYFKIITSKYSIEKNKSFNQGFYILNKIDLVKDNEKEDIIEDFKEKFSIIKEIIQESKNSKYYSFIGFIYNF